MEISKINDFIDIAVNSPLYSNYNLTMDVVNFISDLVKNETVSENCTDVYCKQCSDISTFKISRLNLINDNESLQNQTLFFKLMCSRNPKHILELMFSINHDNVFEKIGQYPSRADIELLQFKKYKKVLEEEKLKELSKAIGLASHGIGIGSFVYLRRVLEFIIERTYSEFKVEISYKDEDYKNHRWPERIKNLEKYLPKFMVDNVKIYGILSKGVHELSEDECLNHFEIMKNSIIYILEEWNSKKDRIKLEKKLNEELKKITMSNS